MNEFSYIDIFATKGIEYLLVIGFFLLLAGFWSFLSVPKKEIRKAQEEREELRRLLDFQRERMETEMASLRDQRDTMRSALLARLQMFEHRAVDAWRKAHPGQDSPPDLGGLLDWVLDAHEELVADGKRLDYLTELAEWKPTLYQTSGADGSIFVLDATANGFGEGTTLRRAIDAARSPQKTNGARA